MQNSLILGEIFNRPLFVTPEKLSAILTVLNNRNGGHLDLDIAALAPMLKTDMSGEIKAEAKPVATTEDRYIKVIPVIGSLISRNRGFSDASGLASYRTLAHQIEIAASDPDILGIMLDIDSYGGSAQGCAGLGRVIVEAKAKKPIYAHVDMNAYSAATWIAAACSKVILADNDAGVGSIGCIAMHREISKRAELEGDKYTVKFWGDKKADFNPLEPLSDELADRLDKSVAQSGLAFAASVAKNRNLKLEDVIAMQAAAFYGSDAIDVGLADEIATFSDTCQMLADDANKKNKKSIFTTGNQAIKSNGQGGTPMSIKEQFQTLLENDSAPGVLAGLGYVPQESMDKGIAEALADSESKGNEKLSTAIDMASLTGLSAAQVAPALKGDLDPKILGSALQTIKAESGQKTITSTTTATTGDGKHPLLVEAEKQAAAR
ncbi:MAG: S49 family peptidase [Desulfotalea sp.]